MGGFSQFCLPLVRSLKAGPTVLPRSWDGLSERDETILIEPTRRRPAYRRHPLACKTTLVVQGISLLGRLDKAQRGLKTSNICCVFLAMQRAYRAVWSTMERLQNIDCVRRDGAVEASER